MSRIKGWRKSSDYLWQSTSDGDEVVFITPDNKVIHEWYDEGSSRKNSRQVVMASSLANAKKIAVDYMRRNP